MSRALAPKNLTASLQINPSAVNQLYISPSTGALSVRQVAATGLAFPANPLAVAEVVTDSVALIRQVNDARPSYIETTGRLLVGLVGGWRTLPCVFNQEIRRHLFELLAKVSIPLLSGGALSRI
jgi:hypothetical protein